MRPGRASRTAQHNTLFRALEGTRPRGLRLVDDPLARAFLGAPFRLVVAAAALPAVGGLVPRAIDRRWPGVRSAVVARTRLIDETIAACAGDAMEQFVILGAGFDSRAYRLPALRGVAVFEVDHPDTQAAKRRALDRALPAPPPHVRFVATDFRQGDLERAMAAAGYREPARSFFLWEGVTNYLTESSVDATLRFCARAGPGSRLLFTYVHRDVLTRPERFVGTPQLFAALERAGERFTWGIEPERLAAFLAGRGLSLESDVGCAEFRERAYGPAARSMHGHEFYRVALARVG